MNHPALILGLAAGYHFGDVRPFALSLKASGFSGRCLLFVSPTTRDTERMEALGLELRHFARPENQAHVPYNAWRYFLYRDFLRDRLRETGAGCGRVLLTDVRDVIFQADPFAFPWPAGLNAVLEDRRMTIGDCPYMARWVRGHLGDAAFDLLRLKPISCSGTLAGDAPDVLAHLERLCSRLLPFTPAPGMAGYDQGLHNLLLHLEPPGCLTFHDNAGPVLTLGYVEGEPTVDAAGNVLNAAGVPAVIVHQYDRKPGLFARIRARYS